MQELEARDVELKVAEAPPGVFQNPSLQRHYTLARQLADSMYGYLPSEKVQINFMTAPFIRHGIVCMMDVRVSRSLLSAEVISMRTIFFLTILAGCLYASDDESKTCSNATVKGQYGYTTTGTTPTGGLGAPIEQGMAVGVRNYDGQGNFTQVDTRKGSITGAVIDQPASGTYTINANCTGVMYLNVSGRPAPVELRLVVVNKGKEIRWILLDPAGPMVMGNAVQQ
jgi:hypothetical protein